MTKTNGAPADPILPDPFTQRVRRVLLFALVGAMLLFTGVLYMARESGRWPLAQVNGNQAANAASSITTTITATASDTPEPSATATNTSLPSQTVTATRIPAKPGDETGFSGEGGTIFLSQYEGGHWRLFAYHPQTLPFTRLTDGPWDDITPAVSPDGATLAFASNREGRWDLYALEIASGKTSRLTDTADYEASPSWSPDGQWLVYETYTNTLTISAPDPNDPSGKTITTSLPNLEIFIRPVDNSQEPIRLTVDAAADFSPAWAPGGRQIAFVSNRSGVNEIWLANLDSIDQRFTNLSQEPRASNLNPVWSPEGTRLAWSSMADGYANLMMLDTTTPGAAPRPVGSGEQPAWSPGGAALLAGLRAANAAYLSGYRLDASGLLLPPVQLTGMLAGLAWGPARLPRPLPAAYSHSAALTPTPPWRAAISSSDGVPSGRQRVVPLEDASAPFPVLQDLADEAFNALRQELADLIGWDFLSTLENAYVPLTSPLFPGLLNDWLYTGRAFTINSAPMSAGWMVVVREDIGANTYWRIYLRSRFQDGSAGRPLVDFPWNFNARYSGDPRFYEQGGAPASALPTGYWVDFTALAISYGWERLPALNNWLSAIPAARYNEFVLAGGLDWYAAMREIYPAEALNTPTPVMPPTFTPTATRRPTRTPTPTRTPFPTRTPTITRTPTLSRTPAITQTPTPTPP